MVTGPTALQGSPPMPLPPGALPTNLPAGSCSPCATSVNGKSTSRK